MIININEIVAKLANVDMNTYIHLLEKGMKPTKALFRLGVEQQLAGILGTLKLAVTQDEINYVYANEDIKSCMTGEPVGEFYSNCGIYVLYNDRYRILIQPSTGWCNHIGYGVLRNTLDSYVQRVYDISKTPNMGYYANHCLDHEYSMLSWNEGGNIGIQKRIYEIFYDFSKLDYKPFMDFDLDKPERIAIDFKSYVYKSKYLKILSWDLKKDLEKVIKNIKSDKDLNLIDDYIVFHNESHQLLSYEKEYKEWYTFYQHKIFEGVLCDLIKIHDKQGIYKHFNTYLVFQSNPAYEPVAFESIEDAIEFIDLPF